MPRTGTLLESAISYYSTLAQLSLAAMRETQEDLRTGQFQVSKTVARGTSLWLDAMDGWWSALLVTASRPTPMVFFQIGDNTSTDSYELPAHVPEDPGFTGLVPLQGTGKAPAVDVTRNSNRTGLVFKLKGIDPKQLNPGLYLGVVHLGNQPLATVMVKVDQPKTAPSPK